MESNCSGCRICQTVCALRNQKETNPSKAALVIEGCFPAPGKYKVHVCNQCGECAQVCPVDAIVKKNGAYIIDHDACIQCMSCIEACPRGVMVQHPNTDVPIKCNNCGECVSICPREVLCFEKQ
ncbi:MAG: 4Fe-4S dicluster domain-containing protein [Bacillota bacterium]|nr:4Fe-4S dicluster domain-containing protein [Bacillota bacterium]MDW7684494.1 4Fe-4S dicluster domain-containing protein [Bacillota bacterium]